MTYEEVRVKLQSYLDLLRLVQVKKDMWEVAVQDASNLKTISASQRVQSSPPPERLNSVEKAADRLFKREVDYMQHCERLWALEDELGMMIACLEESDQTLIIERYMKGESLRYIARKYYFSPDYLKVHKYRRIMEKISTRT